MRESVKRYERKSIQEKLLLSSLSSSSEFPICFYSVSTSPFSLTRPVTDEKLDNCYFWQELNEILRPLSKRLHSTSLCTACLYDAIIPAFYSIGCLYVRKHAGSAQYKNAQSICIFFTVLRCIRHMWHSLSVWLYTTSLSADGNFNGNACNKMNFFHQLLGKS